jgi:trimeric autotransporter adhesin
LRKPDHDSSGIGNADYIAAVRGSLLPSGSGSAMSPIQRFRAALFASVFVLPAGPAFAQIATGGTAGDIVCVGTGGVIQQGTAASCATGTQTTLGALSITATAGVFTSLTATTENVTSLTATTGRITSLTATTGQITNLTATTGQITSLTATTGQITNLTATNLTATTENVTSLTATTGQITNLTASTGQITSLTASTGQITSLTATSGQVTNLTSTTENVTSLTASTANITNLTATNGQFTNLTASGINITGLTVSTANITSLTATTGQITNLTVLNAIGFEGGTGIQIGAGPSIAPDLNSIAVGSNAQALGRGSVAIGTDAKTLASAFNSVALGQGSVADQPNTVSVGAPGSERRITNVAPGIAPTDAVNVSQLSTAIAQVRNQAFQGVATAIALSAPATPLHVGRTAVSVGYGTYGGQNAVGLSFNSLIAGGQSGMALSLNGGLATGFASGSEIGARIGIGVEF